MKRNVTVSRRLIKKHLQALWSRKWMPGIWILKKMTTTTTTTTTIWIPMPMVVVARRTAMSRVILPLQKMLVFQLYFHVPQLETTTFSTHLRYRAATFQNLSPLFRRLLPLVRCSLWRNMNANPHYNSAPSSIAATGPSPSKLDKATAGMSFFPLDPSWPEWTVCWSIAFDAL